jgi:hypothetical protein
MQVVAKAPGAELIHIPPPVNSRRHTTQKQCVDAFDSE